MDPTFSELYRTHYPDVLRFVRRRAREADVDDVVSETFLTAWRRQEQMAVAPLPWLYRTARNVIMNANRAAGRREGLAVSPRYGRASTCSTRRSSRSRSGRGWTAGKPRRSSASAGPRAPCARPGPAVGWPPRSAPPRKKPREPAPPRDTDRSSTGEPAHD